MERLPLTEHGEKGIIPDYDMINSHLPFFSPQRYLIIQGMNMKGQAESSGLGLMPGLKR